MGIKSATLFSRAPAATDHGATARLAQQRRLLMFRGTVALVFATALAAASPHAQAPQRPEQPTARPQADEPREQRRTYEIAGEAEAQISETSHTMRLGNQDIRYTAHAGTLPIRLDNGDLGGRVFFLSYTRSSEDAKTRPGAFFF